MLQTGNPNLGQVLIFLSSVDVLAIRQYSAKLYFTDFPRLHHTCDQSLYLPISKSRAATIVENHLQ